MTKKNSVFFPWQSASSRLQQPVKIITVKKNEINFTKIPLINIVYISIMLCVFTGVIIFIIQDHLPPEIPLFYGLAEGPEQLSSSLGLLIPTILSLGIILINIIIALFVKNDFLKKILIIAGFATALFSTITTFKIILLIGSF